MTIVFVLVAVAVIALIGLVSAGRLGELPEAVRDARPNLKADRPAFDVVVRGYRMDEVDATIDALQAQIAYLTDERAMGNRP